MVNDSTDNEVNQSISLPRKQKIGVAIKKFQISRNDI